MIFLDTSFIVAAEVTHDSNHSRANAVKDALVGGKFGPVVISDYVFDEAVTVTFVRTKDLAAAKILGEHLRSSAEIIRVDDHTFWLAWTIFTNQKETKFSFTDCTTLVLMQKRGIKQIATFDTDFRSVRALTIVGPEKNI